MSQIPVHGTKEGKLFIKSEDLFALPEVQEKIRQASNKNYTNPHDPLTDKEKDFIDRIVKANTTAILMHLAKHPEDMKEFLGDLQTCYKKQ